MHEIFGFAQLLLIDVAKNDLELLGLCKALNKWLETFVSAQSGQVVGGSQLLKEVLIGSYSLLEYVVELPILNVHVHGCLGIFLFH